MHAVFSMILFFPKPYFSLFFCSLLPSLLDHDFFSCTPAGVEPLTFIFAHLSPTSHSSTPLHYEVQLRPTPQKTHYYFTRLVNISKHMHYN